MSLYRVLEHPWVYAFSQWLLAPGAKLTVTRTIRRLLAQLPASSLVLDVGCGPSSWLSRMGLRPVGVDCVMPYLQQYSKQNGHQAVAASGDRLPFAARRFDAVWSFFTLHHLPDALARDVVREMVRVCRLGGSVVIFDGVLPRSPWRRPVSELIGRFDRGRWMRRERDFTSLLPNDIGFTVERMTYTLNGLELLLCWATLGAEQAGASR